MITTGSTTGIETTDRKLIRRVILRFLKQLGPVEDHVLEGAVCASLRNGGPKRDPIPDAVPGSTSYHAAFTALVRRGKAERVGYGYSYSATPKRQ